MTSPQNPTAAQDVQRRVDALRPELPERAEITVDFGRYPIPDIPYLTIVKWALSSTENWPLLAGERVGLDTTSATRGLTEDELRRVIYDDLKRSLWRPTADGFALSWDDGRTRLTVRWSPGALAPDTAPVFATLAATLNTSKANLVDAQPESVAAFRHAIAGASGPADPPRPSFRVEVDRLNLPPDRYPGATDDDRAIELYLRLRFAAVANDALTFTDQTLTIEFADYLSVNLSGLHGDVLALAHLPQFGSPSTHPGSPAAGSRTFLTAQAGADLRVIEHAFATPGYRAHRQAQRRALTIGLSYDKIAQAYHAYDQTFTHESLTKLDSALHGAALARAHDQAFPELFQYGGLVIGEYHNQPNAFQFVTENMDSMKKAGMTHFVVETFDQDYQDDLDRFVFGNKDTMDDRMHVLVRGLEEGRGGGNAVEMFLQAARMNRVPVIAAERTPAHYFLGSGRITHGETAWLYDWEKRLARYNWGAANRAPRNTNTMRSSIGVHITGASHVNTSIFGYPGIAQLKCLPAVRVRNGDFLHLEAYPEDRKCRLIGVPAHSPITPRHPSPSSSLSTSPAMHRPNKRMRLEESHGTNTWSPR